MAEQKSEFDTTKPEELAEWCALTESRLSGLAETIRIQTEGLENLPEFVKQVGDIIPTVTGILEWQTKTQEAVDSCVDLVESLSDMAARTVKEFAALEARVARLERG